MQIRINEQQSPTRKPRLAFHPSPGKKKIKCDTASLALLSKGLCSYQAAAVLAAVGPVVPTVVEPVAALVQALAGDTGVTLGAAEQVSAGAPAVTSCPPAENPPILQGHRA